MDMRGVTGWIGLAAAAVAICGIFLPLAAVGEEAVTIWNPNPAGFFDGLAAIDVASPSLWQMSRIIALFSLVFLVLVAAALRFGDRSGLAPLAFLALLGPAYLVARYGGNLVVPSGPMTLGTWNLGFTMIAVGCLTLLVLGIIAHYAARPAEDR